MLKKPGPLLQISFALTILCSTLVIMAQLFIGAIGARGLDPQDSQRQIGESVAIQLGTVILHTDTARLNKMLAGIAGNSRLIASIGLRDPQGALVGDSGEHWRLWQLLPGSEVGKYQYITALRDGHTDWGQVEVLFKPSSGVAGMLGSFDPMILLVLFVLMFGGPMFWMYMRRALQHLDPASVIPERVQSAFDTMSDGVTIIDSKGRVLLTNTAFRELLPADEPVKQGQVLSEMDWLGGALPHDVAQHPWRIAISENRITTGHSMVVKRADGDLHLIVGCAPVSAPDAPPRGCLVTFSDVTQLYRANADLLLSNKALSESKSEVQRQNEALSLLTKQDPLTGALNRRALFESLELLLEQAESNASQISCLMVDIDHFKQVNDTYGHGVGDIVIQSVAKTLAETTRSVDLAARYGGEEFCVILPDMPYEAARTIAERIRRQIEERVGATVPGVDGMQVTASIGLTVSLPSEVSGQALIDRADKALYVAKRDGRNCVRDNVPDQSVLVYPERQDGSVIVPEFISSGGEDHA